MDLEGFVSLCMPLFESSLDTHHRSVGGTDNHLFGEVWQGKEVRIQAQRNSGITLYF